MCDWTRFLLFWRYIIFPAAINVINQVMIHQEAQCDVLSYRFSSFDPPSLSKDFLTGLAGIATLHLKGSSAIQEVEDQWHQMFDEFGTHFFDTMTTGSQIRMNTFLSEEEVTEFKTFSYKKKVQFSLNLMVASFAGSEGSLRPFFLQARFSKNKLSIRLSAYVTSKEQLTMYAPAKLMVAPEYGCLWCIYTEVTGSMTNWLRERSSNQASIQSINLLHHNSNNSPNYKAVNHTIGQPFHQQINQ